MTIGALHHSEDKLECGLSGSPTSASSKIISPDGGLIAILSNPESL